MATETHLNPVPGTSIVFHSPGQHPLNPGSGQPVVAASKSVGNPNGWVHGQVSGTTVILNNPA
jgi:hypothetical protein